MYIWLDSIYIYIIHIHVYVYVCMCIYIYISVCMLYTKGYYVHARFARYKTMCLRVCVYIYTDSHTYIHTCACRYTSYANAPMHRYVFMYVIIYTPTHTTMHTYIHTYMHRCI